MNSAPELTSIRTWLGLSQRELATLLNVTRVRLAHAEAGSRALPARTRRLLGLLNLCELTVPLPVPDGQLPSPAESAPLSATPVPEPVQARLAECRFQVARLDHELRAMQARASPLLNRLTAVPRLLAALPGTDLPTTLQRRWLERLAGEAADLLGAECGSAPQALLAARRAGYVSEAAQLEQWLAANA